MDNINGIPIRWDLDELNRQIAPLFPNGYNPDAFLRTQTGAEFPKYESPFGEESVFNTPEYVSFIDFKTLIRDIKQFKGKSIPYDFTKYQSKATIPSWLGYLPGKVLVEAAEKSGAENDFARKARDLIRDNRILELPEEPVDDEYVNSRNEVVDLNGFLNTKIGCIKFDREHIRFSFELDAGKRVVKYIDQFRYTDPRTETPLNEWAIHIETDQFESYIELCTAEDFYLSDKTIKWIQADFTNALQAAQASPETMAWLYDKMPYFVLLRRDKKLVIDDLETMLMGRVVQKSSDKINEEAIVLKILDAFNTENTEDQDNFLTQLTTRHLNGKTLFEVLYDKMNDKHGDDNWTAAIIKLYKIWSASRFADADNYTYEGQPEMIAYHSKKMLGFYNSGHALVFKDDKVGIIKKTIEALLKKEIIWYHILQPIHLLQTDDNGELLIQKGELEMLPQIPAFYLKAFDDKNKWENIDKAIQVVIEVALTASAVGNLLKLRYLKYLPKGLYYLRLTTASIQVATSVIDLMLSLVNNCKGSPFCSKLKQYLFWVNIAAGGVDAITEKMVRKAAKEAYDLVKDKTDDIISAEERKVRSHLEEVAGREKKFWKDGYDPDPTKALWGAGKISHPELWEKIINDIKSKDAIIKYSEKNLTYGPSSVAGKPGILTITEDASITALMHEAQHFYDDLAKRFPGMRYWMEDGIKRWEMEFKAYMKEINFLRQKGKFETANEVLKNAKSEKKIIEDYYKIKL